MVGLRTRWPVGRTAGVLDPELHRRVFDAGLCLLAAGSDLRRRANRRVGGLQPQPGSLENRYCDGVIVKTYWRHFKLPLIVTALTLTIMTFVGAALIGPVQPAPAGSPNQQAAKLGQNLGLLATLIVAPFWVYGVLAAGKERRQELKNARPKPANSRRKTKR
ncbi:MAG: hypothetical protein JWN70_3509 [Planctomycetaceae bacterium]|nr:hypothetical protein [Planctomycetaceae bacterium]